MTVLPEQAQQLSILGLIEKGRVEKIIYTSKSPLGTPYGCCLISDINNGHRHTCLADGREVNLDYLPFLIGSTVRLTPTEKGLRLTPWKDQPEEICDLVIAKLQSGSSHEHPRIPELEKEPSPLVEDSQGELTMPNLLPQLTEIIGWVGKTAQKERLATCGYIFLPMPEIEEKEELF